MVMIFWEVHLKNKRSSSYRQQFTRISSCQNLKSCKFPCLLKIGQRVRQHLCLPVAVTGQPS